MSRWEYSVAMNQEEADKGNFVADFGDESEARAYAEKLGADAVVVDCEYMSEA